MEALLEQMAPHPFAEVHRPGVAAMRLSDRLGQRGLLGGYEDQVDMVGHEAPGPDLHTMAGGERGQQVEVGLTIRVGTEDRQRAYPALEDVVREPRQHDSR